MDEAIRRFNDLNRLDGILVSLDADCLVSPDYLQVIERTFNSDKRCFAATLNFRHQEPEMADEKTSFGYQALRRCTCITIKKHSILQAFQTRFIPLGSAFAVRADAYVKQGGMNRRQAGEDFYFLNKLTGFG